MKDMERSLSRTEWREAATGGLYAGLAYALLTIAAHAGRSMPGLVTILNAVSFFSFAGFLYFYARRMAAYAGGDGLHMRDQNAYRVWVEYLARHTVDNRISRNFQTTNEGFAAEMEAIFNPPAQPQA